jgi:hypothetical protein
MQMVKKGFVFFLLFWVALLAFMPKEEIYFRLENELAKQGVEINEASIEEGPFSLTLQQPAIYVKGIKVATAEKVSLLTWLFFTKVQISGLRVDESLRSMVPESAERIVLSHSLLDPLHLSVSAEGKFGELMGKISLKERTVHIDFTDIKSLGTLKSNLKQGEKGWYYETTF